MAKYQLSFGFDATLPPHFSIFMSCVKILTKPKPNLSQPLDILCHKGVGTYGFSHNYFHYNY